MTMKTLIFAYLVVWLTTACAPTHAESATAHPPTVATEFRATPVATLGREARQVAAVAQSQTATESSTECNVAPDERTTHTVRANLDYLERSVIVQQDVWYINRTADFLTELVLNIRANSRDGVFRLEAITLSLSEDPLEYSLHQQRLLIRLPELLRPDCALQFAIRFRVQIPPIELSGRNAFDGYLGYSPRQMNLGQWLPTMAVRQGMDWISHDYVGIGEQEVLDEADWDVAVVVEHAPVGLQVAAPGEVIEADGGYWHYRLTKARDFSMSLGEGFRITRQQTPSGVIVEIYTFDDALVASSGGTIDTAAVALDVATKSVTLFERLFGSYPYQRLLIVQADFPDGMEFTGIVFVGGDFFRNYGGLNGYLSIITAHEVAHQWWYGLVGNDQALAPWLDEALATYSEYLFLSEYYPQYTDWWWDFRINRFSPEGFVDSSVYEFGTRRAYINAIYLRGVRLLHDLRADVGDDTFFQWLRRYAEAGAGRVMTSSDFWNILSPDQLRATEATRQRYLRQPQVIVIATPAP